MLLLGSCKTLDTKLSIERKPMPEHFIKDVPADTLSLAEMDWRTYFGDHKLVRLIDSALAGNPDLHMALQRIEIARSSYRHSSGKRLPKVEGNLSAGLDRFARYTPDHAGNSTTEYEAGKIVPNPLADLQLGLTSSWEVDLWGRLNNEKKAALSRMLASVEGKNLVISNLVADLALAYYELLSLDHELEIIGETLERQQRSLEFVRALKEVGRTDQLAVQQFEARLLDSRALEQQTGQSIAETENRINFLLGRFPQPIERDKENLFQGLPRQMDPGIPSRLLSRRPDIRMAEYGVLASKYDLKAAKAAFFPNFNITAGLGFQAFKPEYLFLGTESIGYSALGGLVAPLINRSALKAEFNRAKADQLEAMYQYGKTLLNAYVEVVNELEGIRRLEQIHDLRNEQTEILGKSVDTSLELYRSAKVGYLDILIAEQNLLDARLDRVAVNYQRQRARVNIYKALGGGWQESD